MQFLGENYGSPRWLQKNSLLAKTVWGYWLSISKTYTLFLYTYGIFPIAASDESLVPFLPESPVQFLFGAPAGGDVDGQEELLEVDEPVLIGVEGSKNVVTKLVGVPRGEALAVDLHEGRGRELAIGAVTFETFIPLFDCVLVVASAGLEELKVMFGQTVFAAFLTHDGAGCQLVGERIKSLLSPLFYFFLPLLLLLSFFSTANYFVLVKLVVCVCM